MGNRQRVSLNLDEEKKELTETQKIAFIIAEEKFGSLSDKNKKQIQEYVQNFDIEKEPYKSDAEKFISDKDKKQQLTKKTISYEKHIVGAYYFKRLEKEEPLWFKNRKVNKQKDAQELSNRMSMLGLAYYYMEDDKLNRMIDEFYEKYGYRMDADYISNVILGREMYKPAYKDYFERVYKGATNKGSIDEMFADYEDIIKRSRHFEDIKTQEWFDNGSMRKKEVSDMLNGLVTHEYDYTRKNKEEISTQCVNSKNKVDVNKVVDFVSEKVNRKNDYDALVDATAALMELQMLHSQRGFFFKLIHKSSYINEENRINELKESMIRQSKELSNNNYVEECLSSNGQKKTVYSPKLAEERVSIAQYVEKNVKESALDIIDEFEIIKKDDEIVLKDLEANEEKEEFIDERTSAKDPEIEDPIQEREKLDIE